MTIERGHRANQADQYYQEAVDADRLGRHEQARASYDKAIAKVLQLPDSGIM